MRYYWYIDESCMNMHDIAWWCGGMNPLPLSRPPWRYPMNPDDTSRARPMTGQQPDSSTKARRIWRSWLRQGNAIFQLPEDDWGIEMDSALAKATFVEFVIVVVFAFCYRFGTRLQTDLCLVATCFAGIQWSTWLVTCNSLSKQGPSGHATATVSIFKR